MRDSFKDLDSDENMSIAEQLVTKQQLTYSLFSYSSYASLIVNSNILFPKLRELVKKSRKQRTHTVVFSLLLSGVVLSNTILLLLLLLSID